MTFRLLQTGNSALIMGLCSYVFFASTELFVYTYAGQILTQVSENENCCGCPDTTDLERRFLVELVRKSVVLVRRPFSETVPHGATA
jgi:hypothetical protein